MSDVPLTSYEDPRWFSANKNIVGNRGFSGRLATLTTTNGIVVTAENGVYGNDPPIKIQYAILASGAPARLYEDGFPALIDRPDLGFSVIMKRAGVWGNYFTLTLINPGRPGPLKIMRPAAKDVVIRLAYAGTAVTTTKAELIAAINGDPELSEYMTAFSSSATASILPAVATRFFLGGADVPGLVLVSLTNTGGTTSTATGAAVSALVNGSRYVSATGGTGTVAAMGATALTGPAAAPATRGTANRGDVSEQYLARRSAWTKRRRAGDPLGKETNKTLQLRDSRFGAPRFHQRVPKQDRAVTTSSFQNHTSDGLAHTYLG